MSKKTFGPLLLIAIDRNTPEKVHDILAKQVHNKAKARDLCTSDIKRLPAEVFDCPLLLAATLEDPTIIKYMVEKHEVNVNFVHQEGTGRRLKLKTALILAVRRGLYDTVEGILSVNADPNIQDQKGRSALHHAVRRADYRMAKMLLIRGAQPNLADKNDNTPLHVATIFGHAELVKLLLRYDADLYRKGQHGAIPIHIAASEGHVSLLRVFCERGVNVNVKVPCYDGREKTPLHAAVEHGHVETAMALIGDHGADVNGKDSEGETPLHCTVLRPYDQLGMRSKDDFVETAKLLLRYGADMDARNGRGETPMHLAARNEFHQVLDVLVRQTADPLIEDNDGHKAIDLVPDDEIVIRQTLKSAMQDRERIMNEVLEVRARGFSTSASSMPLKSLSAMHMPSVCTAPMARTASTPGLFAGSQMVPATIYEDGYLQPLSSRQNLADAAKDEQASAGNTYATIESGTEVTPLQKDPLMTKSPRKRRSRENLLRIRAAKQEPSSDSSQYGEIPAAKTTTAVGGKAPRRQPSNSSSTTSERALPSPPRSPSDAHCSYLTQRTMSETSSLWEVTPRGSMISFMKDLSPEAKPQASRPQEVVIQRSDSMPGSEGGAAAGVKVNKTGKPVIDIQPARGRGKSNESDSDDTYFDDESFDTLDTLSDDSVPPKEEKRKPSPPPKRTAKGPQLHNWLQEQAGLMRQNDLAGPVAHSTPPATRATTTRKFKTALAAPAESDEDRHPPPRAQSTPPPSGESRRRPPPPTPPSDSIVKVVDAKDITVQINDDTVPGTTVITVSKKSTATATKPLISKKPNVAIENRKNPVPLSANADLKTAAQENNNEADVVNAQSISDRIAAFESGTASPAKVAPAAGRKEGRPPPPMPNVQKTATEKETRALPPPPTARSTPPQEASKPAPLQWEKVSLNSDAGIYWEHTTTEDVYACKNLGQVTTVEREETASDATDDIQRPSSSPDTSLSESTDDDEEEDIPNSGHQVAMMYDVSTVEENFTWVTYNIYRDPAAKRNASQSSVDHVTAEPSRHVVAANASSVGDNRVNQPHDNAAPCVGGDSNRAGKVSDPFQLELLTRVNKLAAGESAKTNGVVANANEDIYHEIPDYVREPTHQQQQQQQQQTQRQQYPQQSQQQPVLVNQLHAQKQQQQQPEKLQQQALEQQRQAHQPADQQQQQLLPPPHKRHVTIGSEEIIPNNRQRASDFDHRRVVYDSAGKMRISIVGGNAEGVFVHRIDPGSDADMQGLMEGDEILSVNGKSLKGKTKEEATLLLMSMRGKVDLLVRHRRERYDHIVDNGGMGDAFFVRAHFEHERSQPHDMSVHEGDIFSVRETLPSGKMGSWNAVKVTARANESQEGLIPNRHRAEQIALTRRLEDSRRAAKEKDQQRGGFLRRSFRRSKSLDRLNKIAKEKYVSDEQTLAPESPDAFIAYERVQQQAPGFRRPVVLLGVFCDVVRDRLAADSPGLFEIPCGEIEVAVSRGRGGLADSPPIDVRPIRASMSRNKHCLMIASPRVVQHLTKANLHPVVIYMAAGNRGVLKSIRAKLAPDFPGKASAMMEEAAAFERQHSGLFTATVSYTTNDGWFSLLKDTIKRVQNQALWQTVSDDADGDDDRDGEDPDISLSVESPATGAAATAARMKLNRSTDDIPDSIDDILARRDGPDTAHLEGDMPRPNRLQSYDGYSLPDRGPSGAAGTANAPYPKQLSGSELAGHKPKSILKKNSSYSRSCGNINGESDSLSSTSSYTTYSDAVYQQQQKQVAMHTRPPPLRNAAILAAVGADQQWMTSQGAGQQRQTGRRGARPAGPRARADSRETPL